MTLIVSWASIDKKGKNSQVSAIYILSDSRISWGKQTVWDHGRKVFNFQNHPDILGYCGDVLFTTQVLSQIITIGDLGLLFNATDSFNVKSEAIFYKIKELFENYPQSKSLPSFSIIHCGKQVKGEFGCRKLEWHLTKGWSVSEISIKNHSDILFVDGSGKNEFEKHSKYTNFEFSREICQTFFETLKNIKDPLCGGAPQLAGVYRGDFVKTFGIIYNNKKFALGVEIPDNSKGLALEWRNELFERCDPFTKKVLPNAQRQPKLISSAKRSKFGK